MQNAKVNAECKMQNEIFRFLLTFILYHKCEGIARVKLYIVGTDSPSNVLRSIMCVGEGKDFETCVIKRHGDGSLYQINRKICVDPFVPQWGARVSRLRRVIESMFAALGNAFGAFALSVKCAHLDSFKVFKRRLIRG